MHQVIPDLLETPDKREIRVLPGSLELLDRLASLAVLDFKVTPVCRDLLARQDNQVCISISCSSAHNISDTVSDKFINGI